MDIALCYENVNPARGGCETYIADLARRLVRDRHTVHLYACHWDTHLLPPEMIFHRLEVAKRPRFLRPWRFAQACELAFSPLRHDVSIGFDKTWGQDILYPQGGLHIASAAHNLLKCPNLLSRWLARLGKWLDPAAWSFARLERKQYLGRIRPTIVVNSRMVRGHFERYYGIPPEAIRVIPSAIDPNRFAAVDRLKRREVERTSWGVEPHTTIALFVAMNYRLKGLAPLLRSLRYVPEAADFRLVVVGHPNYRRYARLAQSLGVAARVKFLGFRADPRDAYFAADFLVHPTFYDPCSLVVLEALACGLPVVTSRYNGASELLTPPRDGLILQDPHDARELGQALTWFLDPERRAKCARAARETAQQWTFEMHYRALMEVFREVADRKRRSA